MVAVLIAAATIYWIDTLLAIEGTISTVWINRGPIPISESNGDLGTNGRGTINYPVH